MLVAGGAEQKDGDADKAPSWLPKPMSGGAPKGEKPWYHKDVYFPGVPRPPPGTPCGKHGAIVLRTDPCVIYDPGMGKNEDFVRSMSAEDAEKYKGEWIGLADGRVVAHGKRYGRVYDETCKADLGSPLIHYVFSDEDTGEPAVFLGWY